MGKNLPIYFTSLELENVRCFGERQIFQLTDDKGRLPQWTILLGENGVGKTTLLQCLAWMRPVPASKSPEDDSPETIEPALNSEENTVWNSLLRREDEVRLDLAATLSLGQAMGKRKSPNVQKIETHVQMLGRSGLLEKRMPTENRFPEPSNMSLFDLPIFAYGADRRMGVQNMENAYLSDPIVSLLAGSTELYDSEEILLDLDYRAIKTSNIRNQKRLQQVKQILAAILPEIDGKHIDIRGPKVLGHPEEPSGVLFKTPYAWVPLSGLSLGYQTTLAWTVDLAYRLYKHYPNSSNPLAEPAIVLIDEIDLHLHPRWQRQIVDDIGSHFQKTQFIATTHSPLIVQAAVNANLAVLQQKDGQVVIENRARFEEGWRPDQILTSDLFGITSARSPQYERLIAERNILLDKMSRNASEEKRLKILEKELDSLPTAENHEDQAAMDLIRRAAAHLKGQDSHET